MKIVIIGAGSMSFCPATISDILLNDAICSENLVITLVDINEKVLKLCEEYCRKLCKFTKRSAEITSTTNLDKALNGADFIKLLSKLPEIITGHRIFTFLANMASGRFMVKMEDPVEYSMLLEISSQCLK